MLAKPETQGWDSELGLCPVLGKGDPTVASRGAGLRAKLNGLDSAIPTPGWTLKEAPERL